MNLQITYKINQKEFDKSSPFPMVVAKFTKTSLEKSFLR